MKLSHVVLSAVFLLGACNGRQSRQEEISNSDAPHDSVFLANGATNPVDTVTQQQKKQLDSLIAAARDNNVSLVKKMIDHGADANGRIFRSRYAWDSPLSEAARRNHVEAVKLLVAAGADPNLDLGENLTAFHYSAGGCSLDVGRCSDAIFNLLLAKGGNVNTFNKYNNLTPLLAAIHSGDTTKAKLLIEHGAVLDPDSVNAFQSPLASAVSQMQYEMVSLLLKHGANVNATYTNLHEDCVLCPANITIAHALIGYNNHANKQQVERILNLVLQQKPDLNIESQYGLTPLEFAAYGSDLALIDKLVKHGAKLETQDRSALHCAAEYSNLQMVEHLLTYNINVNIKDASGNTPLHLCLTCCGGGFGEGITEARRAKTIELLLNHGADPTIKNNGGESFIEDCKKSTSKEVIKVLVKRGLLTPNKVSTQ